MTSLEELEERLRALDREEEDLGRQRALTLRAYVQAAGGTNEAVRRLGMDPRTLVRLQRLDELAMVVYRGTGIGYDEDGRPYGELGDEDPSAQQVADSRWWRVAKATRPRIKALVVVTAGTVTRIWQVQPGAPWTEQDGKVAIPLHSPRSTGKPWPATSPNWA
ncbi:hypothetical protein ACFVXG_26870 [Kitasatospora sp. NPDC058162]|uniref:hypothetical protein n=1 Tax=Kitasatospora sp. NPDC058162 TaxID=3346362 RepID=UPI0036DEAB0A